MNSQGIQVGTRQSTPCRIAHLVISRTSAADVIASLPMPSNALYIHTSQAIEASIAAIKRTATCQDSNTEIHGSVGCPTSRYNTQLGLLQEINHAHLRRSRASAQLHYSSGHVLIAQANQLRSRRLCWGNTVAQLFPPRLSLLCAFPLCPPLSPFTTPFF